MNSASRNFTVRLHTDSIAEHVSAFRTALDLFETVEMSDFLPPQEHPKYLEILGELVRLELAHSWMVGKPTSLNAYEEKYPHLFEDAVLVFKIAVEEFRQRRQAGEKPTLAEYCQRFDLRSEDWPTVRIARVPAGDRLNPFLLTPDEVGDLVDDELVKTRRGMTPPAASVAKMPLSEPEVQLQLNEALVEMPVVDGQFAGFHLKQELGKGAFGKVFLAQQGELAGRLVALKVAKDLFVESQTLAQLQHTHIVPIYSFHPGQPYQAVCMPYVGSTTLGHILDDVRRHKNLPGSGKGLVSTLNDRKKKSTLHIDEPAPDSLGGEPAFESGSGVIAGVLPAPTAAPSHLLELEGMSYVDAILWMAVRLADGLAHAHERGIIHRDLKPANILLTDEGLPMLVDFNLAQDAKLRGTAAAASIGGTLPYMAPEHLEAFQGNSQPVDARSDIYSLGVILFELLTGAVPFPSYRKLPMKEIVQRMIHDRRQPAPRLRCLNKAIPPAVESIVRRCLDGDLARRYQSARDLHEDLQRQLDHRPLKHAANPSWVERAAKCRRRYPRLTWMALAVSLLAMLGGLSWSYVEEGRRHAGLVAKDTLARFNSDAIAATALLITPAAPVEGEQGEVLCRQALAHFQVLKNPDWRQAAPVQNLPAEERSRLEADVGQLLFMLAHAQQLAGDRRDDPSRFEAGLQLCSLADTCYGSDQIPQTLWDQKAKLHARLKETAKARKFSERARATELTTAHDRYAAAHVLAKQDKFTEALALIRDGLRQKPQDYNLHFAQGICHYRLAQYAEAAGCFRTCVALRQDFYVGYYYRGLAYLQLGQYENARKDLDETVRLRPELADVYRDRALARQGCGDRAGAEADLTAAIERQPVQAQAYFMRAKLRDQMGKRAEAQADLAEGMRHPPSDENGWIARGIARIGADPKQALQDFEKALELNSRSLAALKNKAHIQAKYLSRPGDAVQTLTRAIEHYPHDSGLLAGRGMYLARSGQRSAALQDAERALHLDKGPATAYQVAGIYALTSRQEPGDEKESLRLLRGALTKGFGFQYLETDRDLDPIRASPAFLRMVDAARALAPQPGKRS